MKFLKNLLIFSIFGLTYGLIEILWRGYTHPSMVIVGGICGLLIGLLNERNKKMNLLLQMVEGMVIVTVLEFVSGIIVNLCLGLNVWDYSNMRFNLLGQVCPQFCIAWFFLSYLVIRIDDFLRKTIINKEDAKK